MIMDITGGKIESMTVSGEEFDVSDDKEQTPSLPSFDGMTLDEEFYLFLFVREGELWKVVQEQLINGKQSHVAAFEPSQQTVDKILALLNETTEE